MTAAFFHADEWHLYYNMISFLWKGLTLERRWVTPWIEARRQKGNAVFSFVTCRNFLNVIVTPISRKSPLTFLLLVVHSQESKKCCAGKCSIWEPETDNKLRISLVCFRMGTGYFACLIGVFAILCNITTIGLGVLAEAAFHDSSYLSQCAVGFSGKLGQKMPLGGLCKSRSPQFVRNFFFSCKFFKLQEGRVLFWADDQFCLWFWKGSKMLGMPWIVDHNFFNISGLILWGLFQVWYLRWRW